MESMSVNIGAEIVSVEKAAFLMDVTERWVRKCVDAGKIHAVESISAIGGGNAGKTYRVYVDSLPAEAQVRYWQESSVAELGFGGQEFDMGGYRERHGEDGMQELLNRQRMTQAAHGLRLQYEERGLRGYNGALTQLAEELGVARGTLYRWERAYAEQGLAGIARPIRADKGKTRSMCPMARDIIVHLMCDERKLPETIVMEELERTHKRLGMDACEHCIHRNTSEARAAYAERFGEEPEMCREAGAGMVLPANRHAVNRVVRQISPETLAYARYGERYWEGHYMVAAKRERSTKVNEVWFGDHHQIDTFVLDENGHPVRPWLTAWMDDHSRALIGWVLTLNPNSDTILTSFLMAAGPTKSPFHGLCKIAYMDNGLDYKSKMFMGVEKGWFEEHERNLGDLNCDMMQSSALQYLGVEAKNAIAFRARTKPIERLFKELEKRTHLFPGWCGNSPANRPQDHPQKIRRLIETGGLMTFDTFAELYKRDVIDAYNNAPGADGLNPIQRYERAEPARTDDPNWATLSIARTQSATRVVSLHGIQLNNTKYQHPELNGLRDKEVTVLYNKGYNPCVTILYEGRFLCEAEPIETLGTVEQDEEKLKRFLASQERQRKGVKTELASYAQLVRGMYKEAYTEEIDEQRDRALARVGSLEATKIQREKEKVAKRQRIKKGMEGGEHKVNQMLNERGKRILRMVEEG